MLKLRILRFFGAAAFLVLAIARADVEAGSATGNSPAARAMQRQRGPDPGTRSNGLTTSILLLKGSPGTGVINEVSEHTVFRSGQRFRLEVNSRRDGFLYILCRTSTG